MLKAIYNGREGEIIAEYSRDGIEYVTMLFSDVEINFIKKDKIICL